MDRNRKKTGRLIAFGVVWLCSATVLGGVLQAQTEFLITSEPQVNEHNLFITTELIAKSYGSGISLQRSDLEFEENYQGNWYPLVVDELIAIEPDVEEKLTVLFLLDISGSMARRLDFALTAIRNTLSKEVRSDLPSNTTFLISTFHDEISPSLPIDPSDPDAILGEISLGRDTDLYGAIIAKSEELSTQDGKRVIILLSDGKQDVGRNPKYVDRPKPSTADVFSSLAKQNEEFLIFPVALGQGFDQATLDFLSTLPDSTQHGVDAYSHATQSEDLTQIFRSLVSGLSGNYRVKLSGAKAPFTGNKRILRATWKGDRAAQANINFQAGSFSNPLTRRIGRRQWLLYAGMGLVSVLALFSILTLLLPFLRRRQFKRDFVRPHEPEPGRVMRDPISQEPIAAGSLVVKKCHYDVPLDIWEDLGEKCPHFPDCVHSVRCNGSGAQAVNPSFFSQKGNLRKLNWLLFGAIGGFFSWLLYALNKGFFPGNPVDVGLHQIVASIPIMSYFEGNCVKCNEIVNDTMVGLCLGVGISLFLAIPDQILRGQRFKVVPILLKILFGGLAGAIAFFCGSILQHELSFAPLVAGMTSWMLFGLLFAFTLPLYSFISFSRALIAGLIASILSFIVYYLAFFFQWQQIELVRLFSMILLGAIVGFVVASVVSRLEDFSISFLAPDQIRGKEIPIGKWINQGADVLVGTAPKSHVFIKWFDAEVEERHALIRLQQNRVVLEALAEVLVAGQPISKGDTVSLKNNYEIQLGRQSRTVLQFQAKKVLESTQAEQHKKKLAGLHKGMKS